MFHLRPSQSWQSRSESGVLPRNCNYPSPSTKLHKVDCPSPSTKLYSIITTPHTPLPLNPTVDRQTPLPPRPLPQFEHNLLAFVIHTYHSPYHGRPNLGRNPSALHTAKLDHPARECQGGSRPLGQGDDVQDEPPQLLVCKIEYQQYHHTYNKRHHAAAASRGAAYGTFPCRCHPASPGVEKYRLPGI